MNGRRLICVVSLVVIILACLEDLNALDIEKARVHNKKAITLFKKGDYKASIKEFIEAYKYNPNPLLLFNIAQVYEKIGKDENALDYFNRYLKEAGNPADALEVKERIGLLEKKLSTLHSTITLTSEPEKVFVYIDKKEKESLLVTPLSRWLDFGPHLLIAYTEGYETMEKPILIEKNQPQKIHLVLKKKKNYGSIAVIADVEGADVYVDGNFVGITPLRAKDFEVGAHSVMVKKAGYKDWIQTAHPRSGKDLVLKAQLTSAANLSLVQQHETSSSFTTPGWISLGIGGALLAAGVVINLVAIDKADDSNSLVNGANETDAAVIKRYNAEFDSAETLSSISYLCYGVGAAGVATGLILLLLDDPSPSSSWNLKPGFQRAGGVITFEMQY